MTPRKYLKDQEVDSDLLQKKEGDEQQASGHDS